MSVPERYLGLTMPHEQDSSQQQQGSAPTAAGMDPAADAQRSTMSAAAPVPDYLARLAQHVSKHVDLGQLLEVASSVEPPVTVVAGGQQQQQQVSGSGGRHDLTLLKTLCQTYRCRIAVARDEAFCFYYQVCRCHTHTL